MDRLEKILLKVIKIGIYLALLTPAVFLPFVIFPFSFGKAMYFQAIIEFILPFFIVLALISPKFRPKKSFILIALLLYFLTLLISTFAGVDWRKSFWGNDERAMGVWSLLHFLVFFLVLTSVLKDKKEWRRIFLFSVIVSLILSLGGWLEYLYPPFWQVARTIYVGKTFSIGTRVVSAFGNPLFFANYLIFSIFITFYLWLSCSLRFWWRIFLGLAASIQIMALQFTGSRGPFLGLVAGLVIFSAIWGLYFKQQLIKKMFLPALIIIVAGGGIAVWFIGQNEFWRQKVLVLPIFRQLAELSLQEATASSRLILWQVALDGFKEHPVLGWGPENFDYLFDKYYNPVSLRFSLYETWGDRAHNAFLDILSTSGIVGLLAYLLLIISLGWSLWRIFQLKILNLSAAASLAGLFSAYLISVAFSFDTTGNLFMFFLASSFVAYSAASTKDASSGSAKIQSFYARKLFLYFYIVIFIFLYFYIFINCTVKPVYASALLLRARSVPPSNPLKRLLTEKAITMRQPYADYLRLRFSNDSFVLADFKETPQDYIVWSLDKAIDEIKKAEKRHPGDFAYPFTLGNLYLKKGLAVHPQNYKEAENYYRRALEISPKRQAVYFQLASLKLLEQHFDEAEEIARQAVALDSEVLQPHWQLGLVLASGGKIEEAYKELKEAVGEPIILKPETEKIGYGLAFSSNNVGELKQAAVVFLIFKDYKTVAVLYESAVKQEPWNAELWAQLAVAYSLGGDRLKLKEALEKAVELDPSLKQEAEEFLKQLP